MEEKIIFKDSEGTKLVGILSNPMLNEIKTIILLVHGFTTSKDNSTNKALQKILNEAEIATFRFDLYRHGESEGKFK
ncbi:hypothetical protein K9L67_00320 [Candidatus Woesearchaeota archaeon]|nr:hypothetical protein [Candidatus Woesearchaeota archaeon]MCF7900651.1 hypothetical protein [Candidatus Woesearchaeota archaeon]MCF8013514.1 hypothetical protein [Candidatus Woesearchaeota archaeon]